MQKNIGAQDKKIRYIIGVVLLLGGLFSGSWIFMVVGLALLITAYIGFCGLYKLLKINTCPVKLVAGPVVVEQKEDDQKNVQ
ncbi:MAG: DUF2892 domain-containing protein [Candidatus Komeilibacteria bacterium CG_4_10_14_0_2_um_filter_37_10]|uniref:DUF2892 domain-containing protein n=1 Tax=Candidatus Komeilibacteria bacterium CG_4_10_14_0_2_um_filter_37_10 TaxID=1974470 RepID=A0A2M7VFT0_9BACT|nr:MAG: DUF2892 domain-containing protein [Candidatus Komeilibacteria bacterium CG_4_10_14_0_2_um_filter_37_10]